MSRNSNLDSSPLHVRRRRLFFIRFYIILFFLLVIIFGLAIFSGSERMKVQTIIVSGNAAISSDSVLAIANRDMAGRYWYLFSKSNSLIFPRLRIKSDLLKEIKAVKDLDISWDNWHQISIAITERKPHSVWCGAALPNNFDKAGFNSVCYFVDKDGYIYGEAPNFSGNIFIRDYGLPSKVGSADQYFLAKDTYSQIFDLVNILDQKGLKVIAVYFDGIDFNFILETGPKIIFNLKNKPASSFSNLFLSVEAGKIDLINGAKLISYVDLRYDEKVIIGRPALLEPAGKKKNE